MKERSDALPRQGPLERALLRWARYFGLFKVKLVNIKGFRGYLRVLLSYLEVFWSYAGGMFGVFFGGAMGCFVGSGCLTLSCLISIIFQWNWES